VNRRIAFVLALMTTVAHAAPSDDLPWEVGVSQAKRDEANSVFAEGNQLFAQQAHGPALEKYKQAIALWDHPLIRFNMAVTLVRLDRILEAAETLDAALRFGAAPYTPEHYQQALDYQRLIAGRVGMIEASCQQDGVSVLLDGKPWLSCPGTKTERVLTGEHLVVGEKKEFATESRRLVVAANKTASTKLQLRSFEDASRLEYPVPRALPYAVAGGGAAIALGGLGFWFAARNQMDRFEADFASMCEMGCESDLADHGLLADARDSAKLKGRIAVTMLIAGSAIAGGGIVWVLLNRPTRVMPKLELEPTDGGVQAAASWSF
jgi:hypothetical protein